MDEGADLSVCYGGPGSWTAPLDAAPLMPDAPTPVATPALAARIGTGGDLAALALIHSRSAPEDWAEWEMACSLPAIAAASKLVVADRSLAIEAALAGRGVALCDAGLVRRLVEAGALAVPLPHLRLARGTAHLVAQLTPRSLPTPPAQKSAVARDGEIARDFSP